MEEGNKCKDFIPFSIRSTIPADVPTLTCLEHQYIWDDIAMRKHDSFGVASSPRRIHQKSKIFFGVMLRPPVTIRSSQISYRGEVLKPSGLVSFVPDQDDHVFCYTSLLRCLLRDRQEWLLRNQSLHARIFQLECELFHRVSWICRAHNTASPVTAPDDSGSVYAIGSEQS